MRMKTLHLVLTGALCLLVSSQLACKGGGGGGGAAAGTTAATSFTVGGPITGLIADGLILENGGQQISVAAGATSFAFSPVPAGTNYDVKILQQPAQGNCSIINAAGTVGSSNVTNVGVSCTTVLVFNFTGAQQDFTIPPGATSIEVDAFGASGANGAGPSGGAMGLGAHVTDTFAAIPGTVYHIFVGGKGVAEVGGFNGGGNGGNAGTNGDGGGGGGATDFRVGGITLAERIFVAGGGGGGGGTGCDATSVAGGAGGAGGGGTGGNGANAATSGGFAGGGTGGSPGVAGLKGIGCGGFQGSNGNVDGTGGAGQTCCCFTNHTDPSGGGGGGGFINGGGGGGGSAGTAGCTGNDKGAGGGGGGGTSLFSASGVEEVGIHIGDGMLVLTIR